MTNNGHMAIDTAKVIGAAVGATTVTLANINAVLTTCSILLAICYTVWKWRKEVKKNG